MSDKGSRDTIVDLGAPIKEGEFQNRESKGDVSSEHYLLASRGSRFMAYILDNIIAAIPSYYIVTSLFGDQMESLEELFQALAAAPLSTVCFMFAANFLCYLVIHGYLLASSGQTVGKKLMNIAIVDEQTEDVLPFGRLVVYRILPVWVLMLIPMGNLLSIIDSAFIFNKDQKCIHDHIAKTKVISVDPRSAFNER